MIGVEVGRAFMSHLLKGERIIEGGKKKPRGTGILRNNTVPTILMLFLSMI
jgi:hypothetical protein